jgi:hypothetical protein
MSSDVLTDERIAALLAMAKNVTAGPKRTKIKEKHEERSFEIEGEDGYRFGVYTRQSLVLRDCFSCGLFWDSPSGESITLVRYNGMGHIHTNRLDGTRIVNKCHIHRLTERYALAGRTSDGFAEETSRYSDLAGALKALGSDCHITGLQGPEPPNSGALFLPGMGGN